MYDLPKGSSLVHVDWQNTDEGHKVFFWTAVDDTLSTKPRRFQLVPTGHPIDKEAVYWGSCLLGAFVMHVVELPADPTALPKGLGEA